MLVEADATSITFRFVTRAREEIDSYTIRLPVGSRQTAPQAPEWHRGLPERAGALALE